VFVVDLGIALLAGAVLGVDESLLGFLGEAVEVHEGILEARWNVPALNCVAIIISACLARLEAFFPSAILMP
jgi:hypothetical protein